MERFTVEFNINRNETTQFLNNIELNLYVEHKTTHNSINILYKYGIMWDASMCFDLIIMRIEYCHI